MAVGGRREVGWSHYTPEQIRIRSELGVRKKRLSQVSVEDNVPRRGPEANRKIGIGKAEILEM